MIGEGASVRYSFGFVEDIGFKGSADGGKRLVHIAKENETLWSIAAAYGTTAEALLTLNPNIISPATVQIGQTVIVGKTHTSNWWDTQY